MPAFKFLETGEEVSRSAGKFLYQARADTPEDAAVLRAMMIRGFKESGDGNIHSPPKQNKAHKSRADKRAKPSVPAQCTQPVFQPTAMAVPILGMLPQLPIVPATPLPMQPLSFAPLM